MPTARNRDVSLYYEADGDGPTVVFINDVGYGAWLWGWHYDAIAGPYETVVWDLRGTGRSDALAGPYDVGTLAADLEAVLADNGVGSAHLVGAGLGGMIALEYAHRYSRARSLTLYCTPGSGDAVDRTALDDLALDAQSSLDGAFSPASREHDPDLMERIADWRADEDATGAARDAQADAMATFDAPPLYEITQPAEVYYGLDDPVVSPEAVQSLSADLPRGTGEAVEGRHCCFIEHAPAVTDRLLALLDEQTE